MRIELHIEELVLHGFSPHERHAIAEAVQVELRRRFAAAPLPDAWAGGARIERLAAPMARPAGSGARIGAAVAGSLHAAMTESGA